MRVRTHRGPARTSRRYRCGIGPVRCPGRSARPLPAFDRVRGARRLGDDADAHVTEIDVPAVGLFGMAAGEVGHRGIQAGRKNGGKGAGARDGKTFAVWFIRQNFFLPIGTNCTLPYR